MKERDLDLFEDFDIEVELEDSEWPKVVNTYLHGSKEYAWELGEMLGLEGDALQNFLGLHYEVELTIEVEEDGDYIITHVDGFPVSVDQE